MRTTAVIRNVTAALAVLAAVSHAHAISISGEIQFQGNALLDGPIGTADAIIGYSGSGPTGKPTVLGGSTTGSYAGVTGGTEVTWSTFVFNPPAASVAPLWSFSHSGANYWFDATSVTVITQNSLFLNIVGTGMAHITGYDATPGSWQITVVGGTANFVFGAYTTAPVPDGGLVGGFLAAGLSGLWLLRRKFSV